VRSPARARWKELYRTKGNKCARSRQRFGWHLDDPAHIASRLGAEIAIKGGVPQGACPDGAMKAAACVPTGEARAAFYVQPNATIVGRRFGLIDAF
jgi:hypothetical protein